MCRKKGALVLRCWEFKLVPATVETTTVWGYLRKLKTHPPCDPAIPLVGRKQNHHLEKISTPPCLLHNYLH